MLDEVRPEDDQGPRTRLDLDKVVVGVKPQLAAPLDVVQIQQIRVAPPLLVQPEAGRRRVDVPLEEAAEWIVEVQPFGLDERTVVEVAERVAD